MTGLPEVHAQILTVANAEAVNELTAAEVDRQSVGPLTRYANAEDRAREKARRKARLVEAFLALKSKKEKVLFAAVHHKPLRTLYAWARLAKLSGGEVSPTLYIRRGMPNRGPKETWPKELVNLAVVTFLQPSAPPASTVARIVRETAADKGWPLPARSTVDRWLKDDTLIPPSLAIMGRRGNRAYRDHGEAVRTRDWSQEPVNGTWIGDHHEMDLFVIHPEGRILRPWITTWEDAHSRLYIGWNLCEKPSSDTIALATRHGILPKEEEGAVGEGVPTQVLCDNGRDYKSHFLNGEVTCAWKQTEDLPVWGFFAELQIRRRWTKTYSARSKGPKERSYGTIERCHVRELPGFCGSNPKERPEGLAQDIALTKKWLETNGAEGERKLLFWWELEEVLPRIVSDYNHHAHSKLSGRSPAEVWEADRPAILPMVKAATLDIMVERGVTRQIHNYGIQITFRAPRETCVYHASDLMGMVGQTVQVRVNPFKRDSITVLKRDAFVCKARRVDQTVPFAESEEEKAELARWMEATAEQKKAFRAYLDGIQQPGLLGFLGPRVPRRIAGRPKHSERKVRLDRAAQEAQGATAAQLTAVGKLLEWNFQKKALEERP